MEISEEGMRKEIMNVTPSGLVKLLAGTFTLLSVAVVLSGAIYKSEEIFNYGVAGMLISVIPYLMSIKSKYPTP